MSGQYHRSTSFFNPLLLSLAAVRVTRAAPNRGLRFPRPQTNRISASGEVRLLHPGVASSPGDSDRYLELQASGLIRWGSCAMIIFIKKKKTRVERISKQEQPRGMLASILTAL